MDQDWKNGFAAFLASRWKADFYHSYPITRHKAWKRWRQLSFELTLDNVDKNWYCNSISQAAERYSWIDNNSELDYVTLSEQLIKAVQNKDDRLACYTCQSIFVWGGVGRQRKGGSDKSVIWLQREEANGSLCTKILEAHSILTSMKAELDRFDGDDLLMNSAMTKVYAAFDPAKLVIYDGRVGAALGLQAKDYLRSIGYRGAVPEALAFPWGSSRGAPVRNPSDEDFNFPRLFGSRRDRLHAKMVRHASDILNTVSSMIALSPACGLPRLEKAMFMIGYDVGRST
ncbi:MAG: hypothetical protein GC187_05770 [Alphaproteobacteria bacterium]|nr:hypothetical protein [Alphaproteobacteria bacterium]